jgi:glycerol-3-phosphate dehydrogenase
LNPKIVAHLIKNYGSEFSHLYRYSEETEEAYTTIPGSSLVIQAEVMHAVRQEMAMKLTDVILRRTDLGSAKYPGDEALEACANIMARELGWDQNRLKQEIIDTKSFYQPVL